MKRSNLLVNSNFPTGPINQVEHHKLLSFEGYEFDYTAEKWSIARASGVIFYDISEKLEPFLLDNYKKKTFHKSLYMDTLQTVEFYSFTLFYILSI